AKQYFTGPTGGSQLFSAFSMAKKGYVYIAANLNNSVLNTGVTNCLRNQLILRTTVNGAGCLQTENQEPRTENHKLKTINHCYH
ncbi:MAG: hypothetical protein KAX05_11420, partial [Bacteroidales bacterium]|nr:hypothetical protein [Bacteroidales bacterium]